MATIDYIYEKPKENRLVSLAKPATKHDYEIALRQVEQSVSQEVDSKLKVERLQFERKISELKDAQLRQMKQDREKHQKQIMLMEKLFKEQFEQFRQQLENMKSSRPENTYPDPFGRQNITEDQQKNPTGHQKEGRSPNYQDESSGQFAMSQLEELLTCLEKANESNKRDTGRGDRNHGPSDFRLNHVNRSAEQDKDPQKDNPEVGQLYGQAKNLEGFESAWPRSKISKQASNVVINDDARKSGDPDKLQVEIFDIIREIVQEKRRDQELKIPAPTFEAAKHVSLGSKVSKTCKLPE